MRAGRTKTGDSQHESFFKIFVFACGKNRKPNHINDFPVPMGVWDRRGTVWDSWDTPDNGIVWDSWDKEAYDEASEAREKSLGKRSLTVLFFP